MAHPNVRLSHLSRVYRVLIRRCLVVVLAASIFTAEPNVAGFSLAWSAPEPRTRPVTQQTGQAKILVEREHQGKDSFILVKVQVPVETRASSFFVASPPRIVVDLEGTRVKRSQALAVPKNNTLQQIRLGTHPEKLRVVLDVFTDPPPQYAIQQEARLITIRITEETGTHKSAGNATPLPEPSPTPQRSQITPAATQKPPTAELDPRPTPTPQAPPAVSTEGPLNTASKEELTGKPEDHSGGGAEGSSSQPVLPSPTVESIRTATPSPLPTVEPTRTATPSPVPTSTTEPSPTPARTPTRIPPRETPRPSATRPSPPLPLPGDSVGEVSIGEANPPEDTVGRLLLLGYKFDYLHPGKIPVLKVTLSKSRTQAQMSKVDPKTYKIVVPGCGISATQLSLPQFPPADFTGFSMVSAQEIDGKTEITISVEPGVTLGTFVRENEIWIKRL
jgi:hypothetical protein